MDNQFIWANSDNKKDEHVDFLDFFTVKTSDGLKCSLEISISGDYIAYVNGERVGYGQYRDYEHYKIKDVLDITPFVRTGENRLCIRGWHTGGETFTNAVKTAGLAFTVLCGDMPILKSSENTLCRISKDYISHREILITPQLGFDYCYDADAYDGWLTAGSEGFSRAVVSTLDVRELLPRPNEKLVELPFVNGKLIQQGVFRWTEGETAAQKMMRAGLAFRWQHELTVKDGDKFTARTDEDCDGLYFIFDLGKEDVGNLCFDIATPEKTTLYVGYGEHLAQGRVSTEIYIRNFSVEYRSKAGRQIFSGEFRRFGLRYLTLFVCGKEIAVDKFGVVPVRYPLKRAEFSTGDFLRDKIYDVSLRTLELCVHEAYEDCPWREQSFYNMDSRNQMLFGYYAFREYQMPRASLELVTHGVRDDGLLSIVFPAGTDLPIPSFNLIVFTQFKEYMRYSGDKEFVRGKEKFLDSLMKTFTDRLNGDCLLPNFPKPCWNFYEWQPTLSGDGADRGLEAPLSAFLAFALGEYADILDEFGKTDKANGLRVLREKINKAIKKAFFVQKDGLFKTFTAADERYSALINALSVLCGAADGEDLSRIEEVLKEENAAGIYECTLSMSVFRYDALLKINAGNARYILSDIDKKYYDMLTAGATTFWETAKGYADFGDAGSLCHGWSALPVLYYHRLLKKES